MVVGIVGAAGVGAVGAVSGEIGAECGVDAAAAAAAVGGAAGGSGGHRPASCRSRRSHRDPVWLQGSAKEGKSAEVQEHVCQIKTTLSNHRVN